MKPHEQVPETWTPLHSQRGHWLQRLEFIRDIMPVYVLS